jgi:hypothetical protein
MKTRNLLFAFAIGTFAIAFTSCKKDTGSSSTTGSTTEAATQSSDQANVSNETDAATNDVNAALDNVGGSYNARPEGVPFRLFWPCDVDSATVVLDSTVNPRTITITYNGSNCSGTRTRVGSVIASFDSTFKWGTPGAVLTITFNGLKVTRAGKTTVINGTRTVTNTSGGLLRNLASLGTITHSIHDTTSITFDDGSQRTWSGNFTRVFAYIDGMQITTTGSLAGENRYGHDFSSTITQPLVVTQCSDYRVVSGQITHSGFLRSVVTTFGLNASASADNNTCETGTLYYQIVWTNTAGTTWTSPLNAY